MTKEVILLDLVRDDLDRVEEKMRSIGAGAYAPLAEAFLHCWAAAANVCGPALALAAYGILCRARLRQGGGGGGRRRDAAQRDPGAR